MSTEILDRMASSRVVVIGDIMLDRYLWGTVDRISPEAPVPVVKVQRTSLAPGGAANVAVSVASLGAQNILIGLIGSDPAADQLAGALENAGVSGSHLLRIGDRATTVKTRLIAHSQQVARIDEEHDVEISESDEDAIIKAAADAIGDADVVVISDYAKGMLTERVICEVIRLSNSASKKVLVDPKGKLYSKYAGASLLTPNRREAAEAVNLDESDANLVESAGRLLLSTTGVDSVLITQGSEGMTLFQKQEAAVHLPALARQVFDVTGAGDTVIATLAAAIGAGASLVDAARLANIAAGLVVEQAGTTSVSLEELREHLDDTPRI